MSSIIMTILINIHVNTDIQKCWFLGGKKAVCDTLPVIKKNPSVVNISVIFIYLKRRIYCSPTRDDFY